MWKERGGGEVTSGGTGSKIVNSKWQRIAASAHDDLRAKEEHQLTIRTWWPIGEVAAGAGSKNRTKTGMQSKLKQKKSSREATACKESELRLNRRRKGDGAKHHSALEGLWRARQAENGMWDPEGEGGHLCWIAQRERKREKHMKKRLDATGYGRQWM